MRITNEVKNFISTHNLIARGDKIIVGVSGGPDSVALLHILYHYQFQSGFYIIAAHYNHSLRKSASNDQKFVEDLCAQLKVPLVCDLWKNPKILSKGSLEEKAREKRLSFFKTIARKEKATAIALAHSADDLAETVLMRILRGAGLNGLRAILPKRNIDGITIIRPLLEISRKSILNYLEKNHLDSRQDPSNKQKVFFRNKIRIDLLPHLERNYNKNIKNVLGCLSKNASLDYDFLENFSKHKFSQLATVSQTKKSITFPISRFIKLHPAIQKMLLRLSFQELKGDTRQLTSTHLAFLDILTYSSQQKDIIRLPSGIKCRKRSSSLEVYK